MAYRSPGSAGPPNPNRPGTSGDDSRKLTEIRSDINKMTKAQLVEECQKYGINSQGKRECVSRRLKNYHKRQRVMSYRPIQNMPNVPDKFFDYVCVVDFECTCEDELYDYEHEIIEFPVILIKTVDMKIVDEFHAIVKPLMRPQLTPFCTKLTGVTQEQVDNAMPFLDVLDQFRNWLNERGLGTTHRYVFVTDGPWDMGKFFQMQCLFSGLDTVPHEFRYWVNIRRTFMNWHTRGGRTAPTHEWKNLQGMLDALHMKFEGREHCGRDDARNISRIVIRLLHEKFELRVNERLLRRDIADKYLEHRREEQDERQKMWQKRREEQERRQMMRYGHLPSYMNSLSIKEQSVPTQNEQPKQEETKEKYEPSEDDKAIRCWKEHLPYKVVSVSRNEFLLDIYEECLTCDEAESESGDES